MTGDQDAYRMNLNRLLAAITEVRYKYTPRMRDLIRLEKKNLICKQHADLGANFITEQLEGCAALWGHRWMCSDCLIRGRHERKREREKKETALT